MIHMKEIWFQYGRKPLFSQLQLDIPPGSIYGLLGMNGAGKTTLLKMISGQLFPLSGTADVLGFDPVKRDVRMLRDLYHLPEEFLLPRMRAESYVSIYAPFYPKFDRNAMGEYCREFGISLDQKLNELSYGQKKKFLLSFGLASNTSLLILDEPTNGLDIPSKSQFRRTVAAAMTEERTFIISTHQVRDMENLIDPIVIVQDGTIVFNSPLDAVSQRFSMQIEAEQPADGEAVHSEKVPGGWMTVRDRRADEEETSVDLEMLFNTVVSNPQAFHHMGGAL